MASEHKLSINAHIWGTNGTNCVQCQQDEQKKVEENKKPQIKYTSKFTNQNRVNGFIVTKW